MAVSEMSRRTGRRRAYSLRQPPEKAEPGMEAHSAHFGNFRNLPQHAKMALGASSAISGQKYAASHRLPQPARQFPTTERLAKRARAQPKRFRTLLATCHFFVCFFRKLTKGPEGSNLGVNISRGRPHIVPRNLALAPFPLLAGRRKWKLHRFWHKRGTSRGPGGEKRTSPQPARLYPAPSASGVPPAPPLRSPPLLHPPLAPFFSLRRPCTHRDKGWVLPPRAPQKWRWSGSFLPAPSAPPPFQFHRGSTRGSPARSEASPSDSPDPFSHFYEWVLRPQSPAAFRARFPLPAPHSRPGLPAATREMAALQRGPLQTSFKPTPAPLARPPRARGPPLPYRPRASLRGGEQHRPGVHSQRQPWWRPRRPGSANPLRSRRLTQSLSLSPRGIFLLLDAWRGPALAPRWRDVLAPLLCRRRRRSEVVAARA